MLGSVAGWSLIICVIFLIFTFVASLSESTLLRKIFFSVALVSLILCIVSLIVSAILGRIAKSSYYEAESVKTYELINLTDCSEINSEVYGTRFYCIATFNEKEVFLYYYRNENGNIERGKKDASCVEINETDIITPSIDEYTTVEKSTINNDLFWYWYGEDKRYTEIAQRYVFNVPKDTVIYKFELDNQ